MTKIKIIGQPMYNIGDLAACKSLTLLLSSKVDTVEYSMFTNRIIDPEFRKIDHAHFANDIPVVNKYEKLFTILFPKALKLASLFFPQLKKKYNALLDSQMVLFAPGSCQKF